MIIAFDFNEKRISIGGELFCWHCTEGLKMINCQRRWLRTYTYLAENEQAATFWCQLKWFSVLHVESNLNDLPT